jgi:uncharacterized protein (TIGR03437 family)
MPSVSRTCRTSAGDHLSDGTDTRPLTEEANQALEVQLSGDGEIAFVVTTKGQILRVNIVSKDDPVREGEVIHAYGIGFGPVAIEVPTGAPSPTTPLPELSSPDFCRFDLGETQDAQVTFAGISY